MVNLKRFNTILKKRDEGFFLSKDVYFCLEFSFLVLSISLILNYTGNILLIAISTFVSFFLFIFSFFVKEMANAKSKLTPNKENEGFFKFCLYLFFISFAFSAFVFLILNMAVSMPYGDDKTSFVTNIYFYFNIFIGLISFSIIFNKFLKLKKRAEYMLKYKHFEKNKKRINSFKENILKDINSLEDLEFYLKIAKEDNANFVIEEFDSIEAAFYEKNGVKTKKEYLIKNRNLQKNISLVENY